MSIWDKRPVPRPVVPVTRLTDKELDEAAARLRPDIEAGLRKHSPRFTFTFNEYEKSVVETALNFIANTRKRSKNKKYSSERLMCECAKALLEKIKK